MVCILYKKTQINILIVTILKIQIQLAHGYVMKRGSIFNPWSDHNITLKYEDVDENL